VIDLGMHVAHSVATYAVSASFEGLIIGVAALTALVKSRLKRM